MLTAVRERRPILADYYTASRSASSIGRRLHPLGILVRNGSWILVAWCCRSSMVKDFAVSGFARIEIVDSEWFEPPTAFELGTHVRDRFRALGGDDTFEVRLLVEREGVPYFRRKLYHPTQQVEDRADGRAEVSFEVEGLDEIAAFVRSWGAKVRVLEPGELAERITQEARETLERYE